MRITATTLDKVFKAKPCTVETMEMLGYELIDELFADSSGFGEDVEAALSVNQFERRIAQLVREHGTLTAKITQSGMFQVYVGLFKKSGTKRAKLLASNVYLIDGNRVRLYDTDIITDNGDGTITLNTGGFSTMTTSKRMNEFSSAHIYRKNWEMYANGQKFEGNSITVDGHLRGVN